jgi:hypothetical protein
LFHESHANGEAIQFVSSGSGDVDFGQYDSAGGSAECYTAGLGLANGIWHHFAAVQQSLSSRQVYIDGIVRCTNSATLGSFTGTYALNLGSEAPNPDLFFRGSLDDLRIYNRALSAQQVRQLYNAGR